MSTEGVLKLLIDTNVWMDYFSGRSDRTANVAHLIEIADARSGLPCLPRRFRSKTFISCLGGNQAGVPKKDWLTER